MECEHCGRGNDADARFCAGCGSKLANLCPSCGHENAPDANFCNRCGTSLLTTPAPAGAPEPDQREARRLTTALFVDLVGFTPFTEQHDPEEVRAMLMRYFDVAKEVVARFGGEIDKFIGDAVLAFWGTTVAREDDAERAVRAALDLVDGVGRLGEELGIPDLAARAGVLTGETSVGSGGNTTGLVIGDIVNTASRLQSIATPGTVFVGDATRRLTEAAIHYEDAGAHELKGKAQPVEVFRAVRVTSTRGGRGRHDGIEPPFVGRGADLRMVQDQLHETTRGGRSRLVSVVGEAGYGKSRLARELKHYVDGLADTYLWHEGRSPAYGDGVSFWALGEMVRQRAGIAETDPALVARTALAEVATLYATDEEEAAWLTRYLSGLLGIDEMPGGDRSELFAALRTFIQRMAETAPVVLVFEDLHWADDGQMAFVEDLVTRSNRHPILVLTLARPSLLERHPDWGRIGAGSGTRLAPLGEDDMRDLVVGTVDDLDEDAADLIVTNSAGIPLYAVEFLRTLVSGGTISRVDGRLRQVAPITDLSTPDSLHAIIAARLDRFPPRLQRVIQDAAVLGQSFTEEWLTRTSDGTDTGSALADLVQAEVLRFDDDPRSPERGQYQFAQPTIREVAYGRLPMSERAGRHLAVAEQFESLGDPEFAAVVADHYLRALEAGAGESALESAHRSLRSAAVRARDLHAHEQVVRLAHKSSELPGTPDATVLRLGAEAASALHQGDTARSLAERAVDVAGDDASRLDGIRTLARVHAAAWDPVTARTIIEEHWDEHRVDEPQMAWLGSELARAMMLADARPEAVPVAELVLGAAERSGDMELVTEAMNTIGTSTAHFHLANGILKEAVSLAERFGSLAALQRALNNLVVIGWADGKMGVRGEMERLHEVEEKLGTPSMGQWGILLAAEGAMAEAKEHLSSARVRLSGINGVPAFGAIVDWTLDGDTEALLRTADTTLGSLPDPERDPQRRFLSLEFGSMAAYLGGDTAGAIDAAEQTQIGLLAAEHAIEVPLLVALETRDAELLARTRSRLDTVGLRFRSFRTVADAIESVLRGDPSGPSQVLEAARLRAEVDGPLTGHILTAVLATVDDSPAVREAADATRRWFAERDAVGYLDRFSAAWDEELEDVG